MSAANLGAAHESPAPPGGDDTETRAEGHDAPWWMAKAMWWNETCRTAWAERDAALAEAARARAEVERLRQHESEVAEAMVEQIDTVARLAAALGRVEALCDEADAHKKREPYYAWVRSSDLRAALSDAGTDEGRGQP